MNPTLETIHQRRSLRSYAPVPITQEEKSTILEAAFRAPTAGNLMLYSIIEVEDQGLKDRLAVTCDNQPFIAKAPYVLLFLADYQRWYDTFQAYGVERRCREMDRTMRKPQEGDLMLAVCDAMIAAQTAVIAAQSLGIGSCYIGDILENYEIHREMFALPEYVVPITLLVFGRPVPGSTLGKMTERFFRKHIVHTNRYRQMEAAELQEMMQPLDERFAALPSTPVGVENAAQNTFFRKFSADFSLEMDRTQ